MVKKVVPYIINIEQDIPDLFVVIIVDACFVVFCVVVDFIGSIKNILLKR